MKKLVLAAFAAITALLTGCAQLPPASPLAYGVSQAQQVQQVQLGTVLAVLRVSIQPNSSGLGGIGGMAAGGFLGHQIGGGRGQTAATVLGAIAGAIAGNRAENAATQSPGVQVTVRLDTGSVIAVTQAADLPLSVGERVQVVGGGWGQAARIMPI
jgi:outer membrane lipoprotein SlyB